jgi:hypothetical protein
MENKRLMIFAITVVALVLLAGFAYILLNQEPEPTTAVAVILSPSDIGPDWQGNPHAEVASPNETSGAMGLFYPSWGLNQSLMPSIMIWISVFNSTSLAKWYFDQGVAKITNNDYYSNCTNISVGDGGFLFFSTTSPYPIINFYVQNVLCNIHIEDGEYNPQSWQSGALVYFATLQAQKIDQYLAEHPGAS